MNMVKDLLNYSDDGLLLYLIDLMYLGLQVFFELFLVLMNLNLIN